MKILIDFRSFDYGNTGGIGNVAYYLIDSIKNSKIEIILDVRASSARKYKEMYSENPNITVIVDPIEGIYHSLKMKNEFIASKLYFLGKIIYKTFHIELFRRRTKWAKSQKADVVIYPYHLVEFQHFHIPSISFIHALLPNYDEKEIKIIETHINNADALVSLWNYPYKEFIARYPQRKRSWFKIPVFNTVNIALEEQKTVDWLRYPYWLDVNFYTERKNRINLIRAYKLAYDKNNSLPDLVLIGKGDYNYYKQVKTLIEDLKLVSKVKAVYDFIPPSQVSFLYHNAKAVIAPTLWEAASGSTIEATLCGKPVACSDVPPLKDFAEWFGLKLLFFDPKDINDMAEKLLLLEKKSRLFSKYAFNNKQKLERYDLEYYADKIMKVIDFVINKGK